MHAHVPVFQLTAEAPYAPLCTYLETLLTQLWYPTTVATLRSGWWWCVCGAVCGAMCDVHKCVVWRECVVAEGSAWQRDVRPACLGEPAGRVECTCCSRRFHTYVVLACLADCLPACPVCAQPAVQGPDSGSV